MKDLWYKLVHYGSSQILPMHMPGHKRKKGFMRGIASYDITEITGFDDLHHPEAEIKEAMAAAKKLYQSDATYFLVNGSTCGILSAITAVADHGDKILLCRNCHKSALNAVTLLGLDPVWLEPPTVSKLNVFGSINPKAVEKALSEHDDIKAMFIVSPTYEGIVSDVESIAAIAHKKGIPLLVDAAHGAHFRFGDMFPKDALSCGADIVIESLHKTMPSLTQTAIMHIKSELVDREKVEFALQTYQSSSPSFILIASILECFRIMEEKGEELMANYQRNLMLLRKAINGFGECYLLQKEDGIFDYDPGKIVLGFHGYYGKELASRLLTKSRIEVEMTAPGYIIAMTSLYDNKEDLFRFQSEMTRLRRELPMRGEGAFPSALTKLPEKAMLPRETQRRKSEQCPIDEAKGRVSSKTLYLYPPGCPLIAAGEIFDEEIIRTAKDCARRGYTVHNLEKGNVSVLKQTEEKE